MHETVILVCRVLRFKIYYHSFIIKNMNESSINHEAHQTFQMKCVQFSHLIQKLRNK